MIDQKKLKKDLERLVENSSNVFIVGHNDSDFDSIGSAIGLQLLCSYLNRKSYIVVDDKVLESGVKRIVEENYNNYQIINKEESIKLINKKSLLIMTDVNPYYLISLKEDLDKFKNIMIIDHHKDSKDTVDTEYKFIDINKSSASEIVTNLLSSYKHLSISSKTANYLLSGIVLDTHGFRKSTQIETMTAARYLIQNGANIDYVNDLFLSEFEDDKKINDLVFSNTIFRIFESTNLDNKNVAFVLNRQKPECIYKREELAKAADQLLKYPIDASFALGYISDEIISISGRSKSDIDVSDILSNIKNIQGGGNPKSAGAKAKDTNPLNVEDLIIDKTIEYLQITHNSLYVLKKNKKY